MPISRTRLYGVEALRGIAACVVVLFHVAKHVDHAKPAPLLLQITRFGHAGVDLFFVLSGFIILFVHAPDIGRPQRWAYYTAKRFLRVYPTFWVALALTILITMAGHHPAVDARLLAWSITLLPSMHEPLLPIAWTLEYEILFYVLFLTMILSRWAGIAIMMLWLAIILANAAGLVAIDPRVPASVFGVFNMEFFLGMGVAVWLRRGPVPLPGWIFLVGAGLLVFAAGLEDAGRFDWYAPGARLAYGVPSALLLLGLVELERAARIIPPHWLRRLGAASYAIYLFQYVWIAACWQALLASGLAARLPAIVIAALLAGLAIAGGLAASRWVERPLARLHRRR